MPRPTLNTPRLTLFPLTYEQLLQYLEPDHALEKSLHLNNAERIISPELKDAFEQMILPAMTDKANNYLFFTLWTVVLKAENVMVGDLGFQGQPNPDGEIELGYGTHAPFQNKGYMTEAVAALVQWAFQQDGVRVIVAETAVNNIASQKILKNNHFQCTGQTEDRLQWRLKKPSAQPGESK